MSYGYTWNGNTFYTTSTTATVGWPQTVYVQSVPQPQPVLSAGHLPDYKEADEDPVEWLRRRIHEVTDLFPVAA